MLPLLQAAAQQPDALQIMNKSRDLSITGSVSANNNFIITGKNGFNMEQGHFIYLQKLSPTDWERYFH